MLGLYVVNKMLTIFIPEVLKRIKLIILDLRLSQMLSLMLIKSKKKVAKLHVLTLPVYRNT